MGCTFTCLVDIELCASTTHLYQLNITVPGQDIFLDVFASWEHHSHLGIRLIRFLLEVPGTATFLHREAGFMFAAVCVLAATVWLADIFARLVDAQAVGFAKWLEDKCFAKRPTEKKTCVA